MYALSVGGSWVFMRQVFRGTQAINMSDASYRYISQESKYRDGGGYTTDIMYDATNDSVDSLPTPSESYLEQRGPVAISGTLLFIVEPYCVTAIEHY